jgi:hypothetical protein
MVRLPTSGQKNSALHSPEFCPHWLHLRPNTVKIATREDFASTLALAYAIAHPATVQTLIPPCGTKRRRADVDYFFQGNAAEFATDPLAMSVPGAYLDSTSPRSSGGMTHSRRHQSAGSSIGTHGS